MIATRVRRTFLPQVRAGIERSHVVKFSAVRIVTTTKNVEELHALHVGQGVAFADRGGLAR